MRMLSLAASLAVLAATWVTPAVADDPLASLKKGTPELKSAGPIAFGPDGILFVGDTQGAALFAVDTGDRPAKPETGPIKVDGLDEKVANLLGTTPQKIQINDLAVNPASGKAYLAVSRGAGPDAAPVLLRVGRDGKLEAVPTENVAFARADLPNAPAAAAQTKGRSSRAQAITDIAYVDGRVFVAGLSNEEFSSRLIAMPFPFTGESKSASIEIYHGAHGQFETKSPVRTFVPYKIKGDSYLLAAYTCTPLVKLPVAELKPGAHVKGTTVAELGNRNNPLDMIVYEQDGRAYLLLANSSRGVMKITTENVEGTTPITQHINGTAGLTYKTIDSLKGVEQLDRLDSGHAIILTRNTSGVNLDTIALP